MQSEDLGWLSRTNPNCRFMSDDALATKQEEAQDVEFYPSCLAQSSVLAMVVGICMTL